jgi:SAM-dependent methyltransferase
MPTIERICPKQLDPNNADDQNTLRIRLQRYRFAAACLSGERVLDMVCGCGYGTALLAELHPDKILLGVDIDPAAVAHAQEHYRLPNLSYRCADAPMRRASAPRNRSTASSAWKPSNTCPARGNWSATMHGCLPGTAR